MTTAISTVEPVVVRRRKRTKVVPPFLMLLRQMLDDASEAMIRWTGDGKAFEIIDVPAFIDHVLPKYFSHRNYASFQRQLNYFNFRKWTRVQATHCTFSNAIFTRDHPELMIQINRKRAPYHTRKLRRHRQGSITASESGDSVSEDAECKVKGWDPWVLPPDELYNSVQQLESSGLYDQPQVVWGFDVEAAFTTVPAYSLSQPSLTRGMISCVGNNYVSKPALEMVQ